MQGDPQKAGLGGRRGRKKKRKGGEGRMHPTHRVLVNRRHMKKTNSLIPVIRGGREGRKRKEKLHEVCILGEIFRPLEARDSNLHLTRNVGKKKKEKKKGEREKKKVFTYASALDSKQISAGKEEWEGGEEKKDPYLKAMAI